MIALRHSLVSLVLVGITLTWTGDPLPASADTVELSGGGHLAGVGSVRQSPAGGRAYVAVQVDESIWVKLPESRVRRVVVSSQLEEYRRRAAIAADDPDLHLALAIWCKAPERGPLPLLDQYRYHLERAIALDADHARARAALGYVLEEGQWQLFADVKRQQGMISVGGKWTVPEADSLRRQEEDADIAAKKWAQEIRRWIKLVARGDRDAWDAIAAIEDPLAAMGLARELTDSIPRDAANRKLRGLLVQILGRLRSSTAVEALVRTVLDDSDLVIRDLAIEQLKQYGQGSAVATLLPMLRSSEERQVSQAAAALAQFPAMPERALQYVDALVTEHKKVIPAGAGMQVGFSDVAGGGMSTGGKAKMIVRKQRNPDMLALLTELEPGFDYGYDKDRWREHFAQKWSQYTGDLRRDP